MVEWEDEPLFKNEEIRDANYHYSKATSFNRNQIPGKQTFPYRNTHDQSVKLQLQGSRDKNFQSVIINLGTEDEVLAGDITPQDNAMILTEFWPYVRIRAKCAIAPTKGFLNSWQEALSNTCD